MVTKIEKIQPWQLIVGDKFKIAESPVTVVATGDMSVMSSRVYIQFEDEFGMVGSLDFYHALPHLEVEMDAKDLRHLH